MNEQKKNFVSLEEALGFLKYINEKKPFDQQKIQIPTKDKDRNNFIRNIEKIPSSQNTHQTSVQSDQISEKNKKLNKNRAIKRIIQSSFQILDKNYKLNEQDEFANEERSSSTQFNIYLKQYNRIIQQINCKETQKVQKIQYINERNQSQLQQLYEYTVKQDYRDRLMVLFTKQKISKNNVDLMIQSFSLGQVILKSNEMKVEFINTEQATKSFKVNQIQNVQYFTQPHIFIVLTVTKDKTKSQEYVYLKFNSQINQDKWDRALYCSFMSKKMNKKDKLFEIQYPVEDVIKKQKEQIKKDTEEYFIQEENIIVQNFDEQEQDQFTHEATQNQQDPNLISDRTNFVSRHRTDDNFVISIINSEDKRRLNTTKNKNTTFKSPFKDTGQNLTKKNTFSKKNNFNESQKKFSQQQSKQAKSSQLNIENLESSKMKNSKGSNSKGSNSVKGQNKQFSETDSIILDKQGEKVNQTVSRNDTLSKGNNNQFLNLMKIAQEKSNISESKHQERIQSQNKSFFKQNESASDRRIRQIQKVNIRGIILQKQKFFFNKDKIIFLSDQAKESLIKQNRNDLSKEVQVPIDIKNKFIQYWDIDVKNRIKSQKKIIRVLDIKQLNIDQKTKNLVINYGDNKEVRFISNLQNISKLKEIQEWFNLLKKSL